MALVDERFLNVNRFGVLSIPMHLGLGIGFLGRHWLMLVATVVLARRSPEAVQLASNHLTWLPLLLELGVVALVYSAFSRVPQAGRTVRWIWSQGLPIIGVTAATNIGLVAWWLWQTPVWARWPDLFLASCALLDLAIVAGCYTSDYIRQIFKEFPAPVDVKERSS